jgi:hypothetical protein
MLKMRTSSAVGKRLEQEVMGKVQGSGLKKMWAVLKYDEGTLHTYASQAMAAAADAGEKAADVLPAVELRAARKLVNLPEKYAGQHVLGLQSLRNSHDLAASLPRFHRNWVVALASRAENGGQIM